MANAKERNNTAFESKTANDNKIIIVNQFHKQAI